MTITEGFGRIPGTADWLPEQAHQWVRAEEIVRAIMNRHGFGEIRTPLMEQTPLFVKGTGTSTDIVQKEMYTFTDRGDRSLTLRPEGTPSVVRAYLEANLGASRPTWKFFYSGPMFRAERPQKGRLRQFHQYGAEIIGPSLPAADIEVIALADATLRALGISQFELQLNSIGEGEARLGHNKALRDFLDRPDVAKSLCEDCLRRAAANPLRIFDCKKEKCAVVIADAPTIDQHLTAEDKNHFEVVQQGLSSLNIPHRINVRMVRGLDYYTRTTFEFITDQLGAQGTLIGGGRYDRLVELYGGPPTPAIGFAAGWERILMIREKVGAETSKPARLDVFICALGDRAVALTPSLLHAIRKLGLSADRDFMGRGLKAQMKEANRHSARQVMIIGDDEIANQKFVLRAMDESKQTEIDADWSHWTAELFLP